MRNAVRLITVWLLFSYKSNYAIARIVCTSAEYKYISHKLPASLVDVSAAIRQHWWMNPEWLQSDREHNTSANGRNTWDALYDTTTTVVGKINFWGLELQRSEMCDSQKIVAQTRRPIPCTKLR
jgi:hypothetical protein